MWWDCHNEPVFKEGCVEYVIFVTVQSYMMLPDEIINNYKAC